MFSRKRRHITPIAALMGGAGVVQGGGGLPAPLIAHTSGKYTSAQSGVTTSPDIDTTGANLIVIMVAWDGGRDGSPPTLSDNKSNSYTALTESDNTPTPNGVLFYLYNPTVGSGHNFTMAANGGDEYAAFAIAAFSNSSAAPLDQQAHVGSGGSSANPAAGSITPTNNNQLVVAGASFSSGTGALTSISQSGGTWTIADKQTGTVNSYTVGIAYQKQTTATATNPVWTADASGTWAAVIASFKGT